VDGSGRGLSMYYPGTCLEVLRTFTKTCQSSLSAGRNLNSGPPEYEGVITTLPRHSVVIH
jgi:hypothetical protein